MSIEIDLTLYYTHDDYLEHRTPPRHPESSSRLVYMNQHLSECGILADVDVRQPELAPITAFASVHSRSLIELLVEMQPTEGIVRIDADTAFSSGSIQAVRRSSGACMDAIDSVLDSGEHKRAFCGVRPPGHHAESSQAMGFCIFNSIAVGAMHALKSLERVAILDFDAHHGNGTVDIFKDEPRVLVCSTFQYPFYPFRLQDVERPNIVNVPLGAGTSSDEFRRRVEESWVPALEAHQPELILVSAGFDAHADDPLAQLELGDNDFEWITGRIVDWAEHYAQGRLVSMLEGGYDFEALSRCAEIHLATLNES